MTTENAPHARRTLTLTQLKALREIAAERSWMVSRHMFRALQKMRLVTPFADLTKYGRATLEAWND